MKQKTKNVLAFIFLLISAILICSTIWVKRNFEFKEFEVLWYTITNPVKGSDSSVIFRGIKNCVLIPLFVLIIGFIIIKKLNDNKLFKLIDNSLLVLSIIVLLITIIFVFIRLDIKEFINNQINKTMIYEEKYVDPSRITFEFPEKKRNLIFINLESMEASFYSTDDGGAFDSNIIPELYELSLTGETFSNVNNQGYYDAPGATWTIASNIATSAGIPYKINEKIPGAYSIGDVLKKEGYINELMKGSDVSFANTNNYYSIHGDYIFKDYIYAINQSWIPEGYRDGWGVNDHTLIEFVKNELTELANQNKPFNLTMETVDTHYEGFNCEYCTDEYDSLILNTLRCSSRLIGEFVNWIKEQPFYKNTTIVLIGDHESMSDEMKVRIKDYDRKCYFTIINPAIEYKGSRERKISSFDIYPTVLASMGVKFNSNRLGLGTNLYSDTPTLLEEMGEDFFNEVSKSSDYYIDNFVKAK